MNEIKIKRITPVGVGVVRNILVHKNHTFLTENGIVTHNCDRLSQGSMDSLKGIVELAESNCRFILTTNNLSKIIDPIKSRTQLIDFSFVQANQKEIIIQYFKRCQFILDTEKVKYDKKVLAEFIQKMYPDFRKITNELQKAAKMFGQIDESIFKISDNAATNDLIKEMKAKKFFNCQQIASNLDADTFYGDFYNQLSELLKPECIPDVILVLAEYSYKNSNCTDKTLNLMGCIVELLKACNWR